MSDGPAGTNPWREWDHKSKEVRTSHVYGGILSGLMKDLDVIPREDEAENAIGDGGLVSLLRKDDEEARRRRAALLMKKLDEVNQELKLVTPIAVAIATTNATAIASTAASITTVGSPTSSAFVSSNIEDM